MKHPTLLILLAAVSVQAQTAPVQPAAKPGEIGRLGLAYADSGDSDGYRLSAEARLIRDFYLQGSFADISANINPYTDDVRAYSLGAAYRFDFGPGKGSVGAAIGALNSDALDGDQHQIRFAYALRPTSELEIEFSLTHYLNDLEGPVGVDTGDLTAPALTIRYTLTKGIGFEASFSTENTLLGIDTGDASWSVGVNFSF
jgi:hypothetical protein